MSHRWIAGMAMLAVVAVFVGLSGDTLDLAHAQTAVAMTPWGEPDLQGVWTDPYATNLQRHPSLGEREFYSEEEVAELDQRRIEIPSSDLVRHRGASRMLRALMTDCISRCGQRGGARRASLIRRMADCLR